MNASWESSFWLDACVGQPGKRLIYRRALGLADISRCGNIGRPSFALLDEDGCMYSPFSGDKALIYVPSKTISHVAQENISAENPRIPESWQVPLADERDRRSAMYAHAVTLFPHLKNMVIAPLIVNPSVSFNTQTRQRYHSSSWQVCEGWFSAVPTKATYSAWAALEIARMIAPASMNGFDLADTPVAPPAFRLL